MTWRAPVYYGWVTRRDPGALSGEGRGEHRYPMRWMPYFIFQNIFTWTQIIPTLAGAPPLLSACAVLPLVRASYFSSAGMVSGCP